tara:strand:- start:127 stop:510 length:384 start_codon:yes stop_codon:yes gene_type:complete
MFPMQEHVDAGQSIAHQERDYFVIWKKVHAGAWQGKSKTIPLKRAYPVCLGNTQIRHLVCGIAKHAQKVNMLAVAALHRVAGVILGPLPIEKVLRLAKCVLWGVNMSTKLLNVQCVVEVIINRPIIL